VLTFMVVQVTQSSVFVGTQHDGRVSLTDSTHYGSTNVIPIYMLHVYISPNNPALMFYLL
jgi:hypothetical protein